jgi:hypothetical protein
MKQKYYKPLFHYNLPNAVCEDCIADYDFIAHSLNSEIVEPLIIRQVGFAAYRSIQLLELKMGKAVIGDGFEFFATTFQPLDIALPA